MCLADVFNINLDVFFASFSVIVHSWRVRGREKQSLLPSCGLAFPAAFSLEVAVIQLSEVKNELLRILTREGRHGDDPPGDQALQSLQFAPGVGEVHFICDDGLRSLGQVRLVLVQFIMQMLELGPGIRRGHVQNEEEEAAALYMT